jgi:hypothetical protein
MKAIVSVGWVFPESYDKPTRNALETAFTPLAQEATSECWRVARIVLGRQSQYPNAGHLGCRRSDLYLNGSQVCLAAFVVAERGLTLPQRILLFVGPLPWLTEQAVEITERLQRTALNEGFPLNSVEYWELALTPGLSTRARKFSQNKGGGH